MLLPKAKTLAGETIGRIKLNGVEETNERREENWREEGKCGGQREGRRKGRRERRSWRDGEKERKRRRVIGYEINYVDKREGGKEGEGRGKEGRWKIYWE